jgi:divalent metal cation (Fe/Co/Zn/Cd) transporter
MTVRPDLEDHGHAGGPVMSRGQAVARARLLNRMSLGWNFAEMFVAVLAGLAAGSVSLVGFGIDSAIEVSASVILAWRLHQERKAGCMLIYDRLATRLIALAFVGVAAYVWVEAVRDLTGGHHPDASPVGIVLAAVSLVLMPWLARAKRALAPTLGSQAVNADADQTSLCAVLSGVLLAGVGLNAALGWWWADPVAALVIGALAVAAAVKTWNAEGLTDTCCG